MVKHRDGILVPPASALASGWWGGVAVSPSPQCPVWDPPGCKRDPLGACSECWREEILEG